MIASNEYAEMFHSEIKSSDHAKNKSPKKRAPMQQIDLNQQVLQRKQDKQRPVHSQLLDSLPMKVAHSSTSSRTRGATAVVARNNREEAKKEALHGPHHRRLDDDAAAENGPDSDSNHLMPPPFVRGYSDQQLDVESVRVARSETHQQPSFPSCRLFPAVSPMLRASRRPIIKMENNNISNIHGLKPRMSPVVVSSSLLFFTTTITSFTR
jgi:hypothetical protein